LLEKRESTVGLGKMAPWANISLGALAAPQIDLATSESCELIDHSSNLFNNNNNLSGENDIKELLTTATLSTTHILCKVLM